MALRMSSLVPSGSLRCFEMLAHGSSVTAAANITGIVMAALAALIQTDHVGVELLPEQERLEGVFGRCKASCYTSVRFRYPQ